MLSLLPVIRGEYAGRRAQSHEAMQSWTGREFARPESTKVHTWEPSRPLGSQSYLIPRKSVARRSNHAGSVVLSERVLHGEEISDSAQRGDHGRDALHDDQIQLESPSSKFPTLVEVDPRLFQQDPTRCEGQEDSLLPQSSPLTMKTIFETPKLNWSPYTLRWPYLLVLILISIGLSAIVALLTWYSATYKGLGDDTGSTILLFGWRFSPTLIAVVFVLLENMLLVDIRRTEVFARLARNNASSAPSTILHAADSWWNDPREALRKQSDGGWRSWALFWASIVNILGMLVISPLSAGLLSTEDMQITRSTAFRQTAAFQKLPLEASADSSTYVRSIASSTVGLTTSAWLSDEYAVLPFWPSDFDTIPLGSMLVASSQTWHGNTTVFQVVMDCEDMWLSEAGYQPPKTIYPPPYKPQPATEVDAYNSIQLTSADGCIYEFAISHGLGNGFFDLGGGWWSKTSGFNYPASRDVVANSGLGDLTVVVADSPQCKNRDVFFVTTPFRNGSTQAAGHVCSSTYYEAEMQTTVATSASRTSVTFDEELFLKTRRPMASNFNVSSFESLFLGPQWATKFQPPGPLISPHPMMGGPILPIASLYNWDVEQMMKNSSIIKEAGAAKQRFLGESMQKTFESMGMQNALPISGQITLLRPRVVLNFAIGVVISGLLFSSALIFIAILFYSRLSKRPLGIGRDPASAAALSSLIGGNETTRACFQRTDRCSKQVLNASLANTAFRLRAGVLSTVESSVHKASAFTYTPFGSSKHKIQSDWRPAVLRGWSGVSGLLFMSILMAGIITLFVKAQQAALYQTIFVYQKTFSIGGSVTADLAPYSVLPTLLAVIVKLWWGALDCTFRRLQPYVSMARRPTKAPEGLTLSYIDSVMLWASWKAFKNSHWLLALITMGAFFTEVFTVVMSALWYRTSGTLIRTMSIPRQLELRTIPSIFNATSPYKSPMDDLDLGDDVVQTVLQEIYGSVLNSWLYSSLVDLSYNGSQAAWTRDDWAFAAVDTSHISLPTVQSVGSNSSSNKADPTSPAVNITVHTPALRARIECTELDLTNTSAWIRTLDFTDRAWWIQSTIPQDLDVGYSLSADDHGTFPLALGRYKEIWPTYYGTTFFVDDSRLICCANETNGVPGKSAIGYWSMNNELNFTVKWIVGHPYEQLAEISEDAGPSIYGGPYLVWQDLPQMTALNCIPVFETADAQVTLDGAGSTVQEYRLTSTPDNSAAAWSDDWLYHEFLPKYDSNGKEEVADPSVNVTVSYGWLFLQALLTAADTSNIGNPVLGTSGQTDGNENLYDQTFNFRQTGLNADFMSYSALALQNNDVEALLDPDTLFKTSNRVFSTFFQHFVADNVTAESGSYGFQPINAVVPGDLGPILNDTGTGLAAYQDRNNTHHLSSTVEATLHIQIEQLHMSPTAVYLCFAILAFLAGTTVWVYIRHRRYFRALPRDVDSIASVLGFVYASPKLLQWVEEHKHEEDWGLKKGEKEVMASMRWFDGEHWGIELLDEGEGMGFDERTKRESERSELGGETEPLAPAKHEPSPRPRRHTRIPIWLMGPLRKPENPDSQ